MTTCSRPASTGEFATVSVMTWSGTSATPFDVQATGGNANSEPTFSAGAITPTAGDLLIDGLGTNNNYDTELTSITISAPFTVLDTLLNPAGESLAVAFAISAGRRRRRAMDDGARMRRPASRRSPAWFH